MFIAQVQNIRVDTFNLRKFEVIQAVTNTEFEKNNKLLKRVE
jgi:hypothetical protein